MAQYTSAYSSFIERLQEIEVLRRFAAEKEKRGPMLHRDQINALCRGAIVLLCGHLEAYIKELGELALEKMYLKKVDRSKVPSRWYYHISKSIIDEIKDTADPDKIADKVFGFIDTDLPYWSKKGPFPLAIVSEDFNQGFANPAYDKIRSYFNRFGYKNYSQELGSHLNKDYQSTITMVDHLVDTRNKIAHGDPMATKTPLEVKAMVYIIRSYCASTDRVFANWWKSEFCTIR